MVPENDLKEEIYVPVAGAVDIRSKLYLHTIAQVLSYHCAVPFAVRTASVHTSSCIFEVLAPRNMTWFEAQKQTVVHEGAHFCLNA